MGCIQSKERAAPYTVPPPNKTHLKNKETAPLEQVALNEYSNEPVASSIPDGPSMATYEDIRELTSTVNMPTVRLMETKKYSLVVAIDFGTTRSAYAYAHISEDKIDIKVNKNWHFDGGAQYKTPTSLCVAKEQPREIHSFGFQAQKDILEEMNLKLFEEFKMQLYNPTKVGRDMRVCAKGDDSFSIPSLDVFAMAIKFLKNHCLDHIQEAGVHVADEAIMWVLTVPAIWKDTQKLFMRQAAVQAGLIANIRSKNLMIALEPEAAAVYCRSVYDEHAMAREVPTQALGARTSQYQLKKGAHFMVVDAGGGTVDITAYECLDNGKSKELIKPEGGAYAGKAVSRNFIDLLKKVFGEDFFDHLSANCQSNLLELMNAFEIAKNDCDPELEKPLLVSLGYIPMLFQEFMDKSLKDYLTESGDSFTMTTQGKLKIQPNYVKGLFQPVVENLVALVVDTLLKPKMEDIATIFLVGGFSQCKYLESQLRKQIEVVKPDVDILKPEAPVLCVLKGAVMCGNNPKLIDSRVAPATYMIEAMDNGKTIYSRIVKKGEQIVHGRVERAYAIPENRSQQDVRMKLFTTEKDAPHDVGDPDIKEVCSVIVACDGDNTMCFEFLFGGTEIEITGRNQDTGAEVTTTIDFLQN